MDDTTRHVLRMRKALEAVKELIPAASASSQIEVDVAASATSTADVSLSPLAPATATTLQSTEELNSVTTSYSTTDPAWTGASTAQATVSGEYDGSSGTDTLTFQVSRGGTHGYVNLLVEVYDSNNTQIDIIDIKKNDAIDKQYILDNGLVLTFSAGEGFNRLSFWRLASRCWLLASNPEPVALHVLLPETAPAGNIKKANCQYPIPNTQSTAPQGNHHRTGQHQQGADAPHSQVFLLENNATIDEPDDDAKALDRYHVSGFGQGNRESMQKDMGKKYKTGNESFSLAGGKGLPFYFAADPKQDQQHDI
jgi:hypothetical protein